MSRCRSCRRNVRIHAGVQLRVCLRRFEEGCRTGLACRCPSRMRRSPFGSLGFHRGQGKESPTHGSQHARRPCSQKNPWGTTRAHTRLSGAQCLEERSPKHAAGFGLTHSASTDARPCRRQPTSCSSGRRRQPTSRVPSGPARELQHRPHEHLRQVAPLVASALPRRKMATFSGDPSFRHTSTHTYTCLLRIHFGSRKGGSPEALRRYC